MRRRRRARARELGSAAAARRADDRGSCSICSIRSGVRATFFVVGWVGERYPRLVEKVMAAGHEIGSHGYQHARAYDLGPDPFQDDLRASLRALAAAGAARVTMFRAPEWSINDRSLWALEILVEEGVTVDASMAPTRSSAPSRIRAILICGTHRPARSPRCRRSSSIGSVRRCRSAGAGAFG